MVVETGDIVVNGRDQEADVDGESAKLVSVLNGAEEPVLATETSCFLLRATTSCLAVGDGDRPNR